MVPVGWVTFVCMHANVISVFGAPDGLNIIDLGQSTLLESKLTICCVRVCVCLGRVQGQHRMSCMGSSHVARGSLYNIWVELLLWISHKWDCDFVVLPNGQNLIDLESVMVG